ncbi:MAG: hypothetical protein LBN24_04025 [Mediterranea sp.]|jgi:hypothetical protein|nr:hypothetical protein [Mediterranea sp.]
MKKILCLFALIGILTSCRVSYPVAQESGKEDMAYLLFVSPRQYADATVQVVIDDAQPFAAKVTKQKKSLRKGTQYAIKTGARTLKVSYEGRTLYQKKIFVSTQEVKQILLP